MADIAGRGTMKAAISSAPWDVHLEDVPIPALQPGEVLVKVKFCGLCGSDLHQFRGSIPLPPYSAGHEISGEVVQVARDVTTAKVGDRVCIEPTVYCGRCRYCRGGHYQLCENYQFISLQLAGGFAEYVRAPAFTLYHLPEGMTYEEGAMMEPLAVAVHSVAASGATPGGSICILGSGTIGLLALGVARANGASRVFMTAKYPQQAKAAAVLGADAVLAADSDVEGEIKRLTDNIGVDAVIETVGGDAPTGPLGMRLVRKRGRLVLLGVFTKEHPINWRTVIMKEMQIVGSHTYSVHSDGGRRDFDVALDLVASRRVNVGALVTHVFPLEQIGDAYQLALKRSDGILKILISC